MLQLNINHNAKNNHKIIKMNWPNFCFTRLQTARLKEIYFHDENIWLTQDKMAKLFVYNNQLSPNT